MTNTAQTVRYHVSDFLQDRHPYNVEQSYVAQRARDHGKVSNGLLPGGLDHLLAAIDDPAVDEVQKVVALRHLHAHSASAEKKIALLRKDIVPRLSDLLERKPSVMAEHLCMQLFRSLCILPQGAHCVVVQGGLRLMTLALSNRDDLEARGDARASAANAMTLVAASWAGRAWLLGQPCPPDLQLVDYPTPEPSDEQAAHLAQAVADVLVGCVEQDAGSPLVVVHCLHAIAQLAVDKAGAQKCLIAGALRGAATALERFVREDTWVYAEGTVERETVLHAATAVWHLVLDDVGKAEATGLPFVSQLAHLVAFVLPVKDKLLTLKAALAGAACALAMHPPLKLEAVAPVTNFGGSPASLLDVLLALLRQANELYKPIYQAQKLGRPNPLPGIRLEHAAAIVKNCVQAVRLVVELPAARDALQRTLATEGDGTYELRRQLFYATPYQDTFGVRPV